MNYGTIYLTIFKNFNFLKSKIWEFLIGSFANIIKHPEMKLNKDAPFVET